MSISQTRDNYLSLSERIVADCTQVDAERDSKTLEIDAVFAEFGSNPLTLDFLVKNVSEE